MLVSHFYFLPKHHLFKEFKNLLTSCQCDHEAYRVATAHIIITSKLLLVVILFIAAHIVVFSSCTDGPLQLFRVP